jgi:DNA-binding PadR family transcriptional regulator
MNEHGMHQGEVRGCNCGQQHGGGPRTMNEHGMHQGRMHGGGRGGGCGGEGGCGGGGGGMRRRRSPRGRVRREILVLLAQGPKHGYELMQLIAERNGGVWQPSPGSIYPTLSMLEDAGLIVGREEEGRKIYTLTDAGRAEAETMTFGPDEENSGREIDLGREIRAAFQALRQLDLVGTLEQRQRARGLLAQLRRDLYQMLAEDPSTPQE